jgi:ADP-heptose:LPS heptosyltransferase
VESRIRWGVQKSTAEEVTQLLSEHKLKKDPALVCIDLASLEGNCGKEWAAELMKALKNAKNIGQFYIFGGTEEDNDAFGDAPFAVLPKMSIPRTAALIACTDVVITGFGALFGLAQISSRSKIVPVLTKEQAEMYCKRSVRIAPVVFSQTPGAEEVKSVQKGLRELMAVTVAGAEEAQKGAEKPLKSNSLIG